MEAAPYERRKERNDEKCTDKAELLTDDGENKIVLCGKASSNFEGSKDTLPLIVAYNLNSDTLLWENLNFINYKDIGDIIPNAINTYILQLKTNSNLHYVSADLLGN